MQTQSRIARLRHIHTHLYAKQYLINLEAETNSIVHTLLYVYLAHEQDTILVLAYLALYLTIDYPLCSVGCIPLPLGDYNTIFFSISINDNDFFVYSKFILGGHGRESSLPVILNTKSDQTA